MSNSLQASGTVKLVCDTQEFSSGFRKREFVITTDEKYPQDIKFEVVKEKCDDLDQIGEGDDITVHFNLRGNEYNGRYYVNLQAWKIEGGSAPQGKQEEPRKQQAAKQQEPAEYEEDDEIPF